MKLTVDQVKQSLKSCGEDVLCRNCFYEGKCSELPKDALAVIEALQKEKDESLKNAEEKIKSELISSCVSCYWCEKQITISAIRKIREKLKDCFKKNSAQIYTEQTICNYIDCVLEEEINGKSHL